MRGLAWRAAGVIAAVYGYFLLFAQFAFIELLRHGTAAPSHANAGAIEKLALGLMALAGIAAGFGVAWKGASPMKVRLGLVLAAASAGVAPWVHHLMGALVIAVLTGAAIGFSTVSLAPLLRSWCGLIAIGAGVGLGYGACNLPFVFAQTPDHQAWIAASFAVVGAVCVPGQAGSRESVSDGQIAFSFPIAVLLFTALVWLDSAAFFVIQHAPELKVETWASHLLWRNVALHFFAAVAAGIWMMKGGGRALVAAAWLLLESAAWAVSHPGSQAISGWLYPVAVSLYSAALVAWPAWFCGRLDERAITWRAAWLYAVAGWFGSANGIGMVQSLHHIPMMFIIISSVGVMAAFFWTYRTRWREASAIGAVLLISAASSLQSESKASSTAGRGKQVYLSEGCIHCHSQYIRPGSRDMEYWGPAHAWPTFDRPVLIGNRRQGPDLINIGARRSFTWLKQHLISPQAFSPGSAMPSYAYLFQDGRGDDLVSYLKELGEKEMPSLVTKAAQWNPGATLNENPSASGPALFATQCAICHGDGAQGNGSMARRLVRPPANLVSGPFLWSPASPDQELRVCRIIKFGLPGTDMPGHETLEDAQILSLAKYVLSLRQPGH